MRYFLDFEFSELINTSPTIDLIAIGIVCEDGRELYLQSCEFNPKKASPWVQENVIAHLTLCPYTDNGRVKSLYQHRHGQCLDQQRGLLHRCPWRTRSQMRHDIALFFNPSSSMEWWGWITAYDMVALCQLFGGMMGLPAGWPHYIRDFQQLLDERGIADDELPEQEEGLHHSLADARHLKKLWGYIVRNDAWQ